MAWSPSVFSAQGYETAQFIVESLNKLGGETADQQKLLDIMKGITFMAPSGEFKLDPETQNIILTIFIRLRATPRTSGGFSCGR